MPVDQDVLRRLAFIRYLHTLGIEQARLPVPLSSASLLMLHDAVEGFLILATDRLGAKASPNFEKYWETLSPHLPDGVDLAVQQGMKRLNKARVNLKHYDARPDPATIDMAVADTATFMAANTILVFGVDYDTVSMADVISQAPVRDLVRKAEAASEAGDQTAAMIVLVDALNDLFDPHSPKPWGLATSPLMFGRKIDRAMSEGLIERMLRPLATDRFGAGRDASTLAAQIAQVTEVSKTLQDAMRMVSLGLDFAEYQRFRSLTPTRSVFGDMRREYKAPRGYAPTRDDFTFCHQFVVTASLRLAAAEANLAQPAWIPTDKPVWQVEYETVAEMREAEDDGTVTAASATA
ncbi:hypothetical protein AB0B57_26890 [Micromonospora sp. NPDC049101]|uniref:hypothetical protein n=1 Tax=unclassified Micromonospora TaxID=2617518 RepID=UPI0033CB1C5C